MNTTRRVTNQHSSNAVTQVPATLAYWPCSPVQSGYRCTIVVWTPNLVMIR